jgi:hypothetical protein
MMIKISDIRNGFDSLRRLGLREAASVFVATMRQRYQHALGARFDRRYGIDASGKQNLTHYTVRGDMSDGNRYEGMYTGLAPHLWSLLPTDVSNFTFVDFGAGKGRGCLSAAQKNFKKIIGVEFAQELCADMERNIRVFKSPWQRCFNLEVVCVDATQFEIPDGDCVLFFFNPFKRKTLKAVIDNIESSLRQKPRHMLILYYYPSPNSGASGVLEGMQSFRQIPVRMSIGFKLLSPFGVVLYENK